MTSDRNESLQAAARQLREAYTQGPIAPLRDVLDPVDGEGAYLVQAINTEHWKASGRRVVGRKAGLTSEVVQKQLGVDQPDYGVLFDDMRIADGGVLDPSRVIQPKVEAEIAFILSRDVTDPDIGPADLAGAVASVHAALEIVDSRIADWKIAFADTVADNGSSAFFVLAEQGVPLAGLDLETAAMTMSVNAQTASTGLGSAALGNPLNAAAWLARTVADTGDPLKAGDILLAGALGPMAVLAPGDTVHTSIEGIGSCSFALGSGA